ncbi:MAG: DUF1987 domain-containing protein [Pseudomonadota bacterium]
MDNLLIAASKSTPQVHFDAQANRLEIKGESYPENASKFYAPLFDWLGAYLGQVAPEVLVVVEMEIIYFNSSSSKALMNIFDQLALAAADGRRVVVNWRYHSRNESALECGEEFSEDVEGVEFNLVEIDG